MIVLAGDVGGTKVNLGLFEVPEAAEHPSRVESRRFPSAAHTGLEAICREFLRGRGEKLSAAAFGIAGPIVDGATRTTNLPWVIEAASIERTLGCRVALLNDLEATAHGVATLSPSGIQVLNEGDEVAGGARAIIAAGTGLGQGYMVYDAGRGHYLPAASEGGHCDFAPRNAAEIELLDRLSDRYGRVSVERVVSGLGIVNIFSHLMETGRYEVPPGLREAVEGPDGAQAVSRAAMQDGVPICVDAMGQFVASYGAEAGNLALKILALGGLYVGGGIAPKILPLMTDGRFMESFTDKGRFEALMRRIPVRIILDPGTAMAGAALAAGRLARSRR